MLLARQGKWPKTLYYTTDQPSLEEKKVKMAHSLILLTLKVENFAGTKFRGFRGFKGQPRNLIPAKPLKLPIREI